MVSGIVADERDWQAVADACYLTEPKAREIVEAVLSEDNVRRMTQAGADAAPSHVLPPVIAQTPGTARLRDLYTAEGAQAALDSKPRQHPDDANSVVTAWWLAGYDRAMTDICAPPAKA